MTHADSTRDLSNSDQSGVQPPVPNSGTSQPAPAKTNTAPSTTPLPPVRGASLSSNRQVVPPPPPAAQSARISRPDLATSEQSVQTPPAKAPVAPQDGVSVGASGLPVPPPPPPRSTLPPIRTPAEVTVTTGVGSAKGLRWRNELAGIADTPSKPQRVDASVGDLEPPTGDPPDPTTQDHVTREAPSWLVSMVIHLILLLILAFISTPAGDSVGSLLLSIGQSSRGTAVDFSDFDISPADIPNQSEMMEDTDAEIDLTSLFESSEMTELDQLMPVEVGGGPQLHPLKPMFNGRSGALKAALLARYGGTMKTQEAVKLGLQWLKRNQQKKGNWSMRGPYTDGGFTENETAATAMALLAYLGDGHTHKKGEYANVVERGMKFLIAQQDREGFFAKNARSHEKMYAQAQATIAICELYGMTRDSWLRPYAQKAIDFAEKSQSEQGGWRYEPNFDSDTSMTGWYVMALESGRAADLEVNVSVLNRVMLFLDDVASYDGAAYGYQINRGASSAMTAEGLLCRQYIGWKRNHPPLVRGVDALLQDAPFNMRDRDVYYWYYATQVLHHFGGSPWRRWNDVMKVELPKAQVKTGRESGSWAPQLDRWGKNSGRLYTTCLSLYCLEVYYRHMPLYKADGGQQD